MGTSHRRYPVQLTEEQRQWLEMMVRTSSTPTKHYLVARVLLMSDQCHSEPSATDGQIAEALQISRRTVIRIKKRFVLENMQVALTGSFPCERPERRCLDGKGEAQLIQLACSQAPDGRQRWNCSRKMDIRGQPTRSFVFTLLTTLLGMAQRAAVSIARPLWFCKSVPEVRLVPVTLCCSFQGFTAFLWKCMLLLALMCSGSAVNSVFDTVKVREPSA